MSDEARADRELWHEKAGHWHRHVGEEGDANRRQALHPVLFRMLGEVGGLRVLDAGCGTGYLSRKLARAGAEILAVDYAGGMVEVARRRAREEGLTLEVRRDDCCRLESVASGSFDRLVSVYVLQDLADHRAALRAFRRVLRDGGEAVVLFGHPAFGVPGGVEREPDGTVVLRQPYSYFDELRCEETWQGTDAASGERFEFPGPFTYYHRPLRSYWRAIREAGFRVLELDEPEFTRETAPELDEEQLARRRAVAWSIAVHLEAEG